MGYIRHDAIVVTSFDAKRAEPASLKAIKLGLTCSELVHSPINGYVSFFIAPDGSKEGWPESDTGDRSRAAWIAWANSIEATGIDWVHVTYGGDAPERVDVKDHAGKE